MVVDNLVDVDVPATGANWYAKRMRCLTGRRGLHLSNVRVYLNDNADHLDAPPIDGVRATYLVDWYDSVYQALRDLSAWAEVGANPPGSTAYRADGGDHHRSEVARMPARESSRLSI